MHTFSKDVAVISSLMGQKGDMRTHKYLGTSIENLVAQNLCTTTYSSYIYDIWVCCLLQQLNFKYS